MYRKESRSCTGSLERKKWSNNQKLIHIEHTYNWSLSVKLEKCTIFYSKGGKAILAAGSWWHNIQCYSEINLYYENFVWWLEHLRILKPPSLKLEKHG